MKKLVIILAVVLGSISFLSAQSLSFKSSVSDISGVSSSTYSTPKYTNYNTTHKSDCSYLTSQTYSTPKSYTKVNTIRTSFGNNSYMSGTDVYSNGTRRSSSRTTSLYYGGYRMTNTNYYNNSGNIKSSRIRVKYYGW